MSIRQYLKKKINSIKNIIKNSLYKINEFFLRPCENDSFMLK